MRPPTSGLQYLVSLPMVLHIQVPDQQIKKDSEKSSNTFEVPNQHVSCVFIDYLPNIVSVGETCEYMGWSRF